MAAPIEPPITPVPLPQGVKQVLVFGGTFDPPHAGHGRMADMARLGMLGTGAWLLYVPAAQNPLKNSAPCAPAADRTAMLRILLSTTDRVQGAIWTDEVDRSQMQPGPTYTIDTIERLRRVAPDADIRLLIGSDQAADFHRWRSARDLFTRTRPIVMLREPVASLRALRSALAETGAWSLAEIEAWLSRVPEIGVLDMSSSGLRELLKDPAANRAALQAALSPPVLDYIEAHKLYG